MALLTTINQINIYSNQAGITCGITPTSPLEGTGSLRTWRNTAPEFTMHTARTTAPYRFVSGYGYLRWALDTTVSLLSYRLGYYCCSAVADLTTGGAGLCYSVWCYLSTTQLLLFISAFPNGLAATEGAGTSVAVTPIYTTLGTVYTLALTWVYDPRYGGLLVKAWLEPGPTLPDVWTTPPRLSYLFPLGSAPTSLGEGEWCRPVTSGLNTGFISDQVGRYALLITG